MAKHWANHGIELAQHNSPPNASTSNCGLYEWQHHDYNASVAPFVCYANWSFWVVVFRSSHPIHFIYFPFASFIFFSLSFFFTHQTMWLESFLVFFSPELIIVLMSCEQYIQHIEKTTKEEAFSTHIYSQLSRYKRTRKCAAQKENDKNKSALAGNKSWMNVEPKLFARRIETLFFFITFTFNYFDQHLI